MAVRTAVRTAARTALVAGVATTAVWGGAGPAAAASSGDAVGTHSWRVNALFADQDADRGALVEVTVTEVAANRATVRVGLFLDGWVCTTDGQPEVADIVRLESARVVGTVDYSCSAATGGGQGLTSDALHGSVLVDAAWAGVGDPVAQPLFDGAVGRYVVRAAEVSATVSLEGDLSADLGVDSAQLAREVTVFPPGRLR